MINIDNNSLAYILLFITIMTVIMLLILVFIIRQQIYMKRLYEKVDFGAALATVPKAESMDSSMQTPEEELLSSETETDDSSVSSELRDEMLRKEKEEERRRLEEERSKDPAEYYRGDSIREDLIALFDRYKLNSFTMSTSDGLVISSTDPNPEEDAARFSYLYQQGKQPDVENIRLIGVPYKGGIVVGIVKTEAELSEKELEFIERDIHFILKKSV